jgi:hypothetical protein
MQDQVDAGRDARAAVDGRVDHEHPVAHHVAARLHRPQLTQVMVVRGGAPARERAGMRGQHCAGADGHQFEPVALEAQAAQPVQQFLRLGVVGGDGVAGKSHQHDPARAVPLRGQGREPGNLDTDGTHRARPGARELDGEALGLPHGPQALVGDAQRLGRPGPVEHQAAGQQHEDYADGWAGRAAGSRVHA